MPIKKDLSQKNNSGMFANLTKKLVKTVVEWKAIEWIIEDLDTARVGKNWTIIYLIHSFVRMLLLSFCLCKLSDYLCF